MQKDGCTIVLHPNAAFLYRKQLHDVVNVARTPEEFELSFTLTGSHGLVKSSVDVQHRDLSFRGQAVHVSRSNKYSTVVVTSNGEFTGRLLKTQTIGNSLSATLEVDGIETTVIDVQSVTKLKPGYEVHFTGSLPRGSIPVYTIPRILAMQIQYVLSTINSTVQYSLFRGKDDGDPFEIQQNLYVENRSGADHTAQLYYTTSPFDSRIQEKAELAFASRSVPQIKNVAVFRAKVLSMGVRTLRKTTLIPIVTRELQNVATHFEINLSIRRRTVEARAAPVVKLPLNKLKLVDGSLKFFNAHGVYITSGRLIVGAKSARARLVEVDYGVRVSNEIIFEETENVLRVQNAFVFFSSAAKTVRLLVDYERQLNYSQGTYLRKDSKKLVFQVTPGKSTQRTTVEFIRLDIK